jgi:hypothetical protein
MRKKKQKKIEVISIFFGIDTFHNAFNNLKSANNDLNAINVEGTFFGLSIKRNCTMKLFFRS